MIDSPEPMGHDGPPRLRRHRDNRLGAASRRLSALVGGVGLIIALGACRVILPIFGYPPAAQRNTPPPGIDRQILAEGRPAPAIELPSTRDLWSLTADTQHLLVFYRGAW